MFLVVINLLMSFWVWPQVMLSLEKVWKRCRAHNSVLPAEFLDFKFIQISFDLHFVVFWKQFSKNIVKKIGVTITIFWAISRYKAVAPIWQHGQRNTKQQWSPHVDLSPTIRGVPSYLGTPPDCRTYPWRRWCCIFPLHSIYRICAPTRDPHGHCDEDRPTGGANIPQERIGVFCWTSGRGFLTDFSKTVLFGINRL